MESLSSTPPNGERGLVEVTLESAEILDIFTVHDIHLIVRPLQRSWHCRRTGDR